MNNIEVNEESFKESIITYRTEKVFDTNKGKLLFHQAKDLFFDHTDSKWSAPKCVDFILKHEISPEELKEFLYYLFSLYYQNSRSKKGAIGAFNFISKLEEHQKYNSVNYHLNLLLPLKTDFDFYSVISALEELRKQCIHIPKETWILNIYNQTPKTIKYSTFRRKYFEHQEK